MICACPSWGPSAACALRAPLYASCAHSPLVRFSNKNNFACKSNPEPMAIPKKNKQTNKKTSPPSLWYTSDKPPAPSRHTHKAQGEMMHRNDKPNISVCAI